MLPPFLPNQLLLLLSLKEKFFQLKKSVVLTSATLTVNHSFDYIIHGLGLNPEVITKMSIPSPFEYKNQVQLLIPEDLPEINAVSLEELCYCDN